MCVFCSCAYHVVHLDRANRAPSFPTVFLAVTPVLCGTVTPFTSTASTPTTGERRDLETLMGLLVLVLVLLLLLALMLVLLLALVQTL